MNTTQCNDRKQRYKMLLDESNVLQQEIGHVLPSETCKVVQNIVQNCDSIHKETSITEKIENTSEIVMDVLVMKSAHESLSKLLANSECNDGTYSNSINALISQNGSENWRVITEIVINVARPAFTKSSMLGAIDVEPKERVMKERQQRRRTAIQEEKRPETIKQLKRKDRGAEKVNIILKQVSDLFRSNNRQPIPYYRLIIDPDNFMNTVENAFQMAFLARDGNIAIERGDDGYPHVRLAGKDEIEQQRDTSQSICSLNMNLCQDMIRFYEIKKPLLYVPDEINNEDSADANDSDNDD